MVRYVRRVFVVVVKQHDKRCGRWFDVSYVLDVYLFDSYF